MRRDLAPGVALAQTIHAAGESGPALSGTFAVALAAADEAELLGLSQALADAGVPHVLIREPDAPHNGAAMSLGIPPGPRDHLRKLLRRFPLYK